MQNLKVLLFFLLYIASFSSFASSKVLNIVSPCETWVLESSKKNTETFQCNGKLKVPYLKSFSLNELLKTVIDASLKSLMERSYEIIKSTTTNSGNNNVEVEITQISQLITLESYDYYLENGFLHIKINAAVKGLDLNTLIPSSTIDSNWLKVNLERNEFTTKVKNKEVKKTPQLNKLREQNELQGLLAVIYERIFDPKHWEIAKPELNMRRAGSSNMREVYLTPNYAHQTAFNDIEGFLFHGLSEEHRALLSRNIEIFEFLSYVGQEQVERGFIVSVPYFKSRHKKLNLKLQIGSESLSEALVEQVNIGDMYFSRYGDLLREHKDKHSLRIISYKGPQTLFPTMSMNVSKVKSHDDVKINKVVLGSGFERVKINYSFTYEGF